MDGKVNQKLRWFYIEKGMNGENLLCARRLYFWIEHANGE
jgi:hypothetical protein